MNGTLVSYVILFSLTLKTGIIVGIILFSLYFTILGYRILLDNELIFSGKVRDDLYKKLVVEFPGEF